MALTDEEWKLPPLRQSASPNLQSVHMRIFLHDYSGHPFQVQLSRWLAAQGHTVLHTYSADFETPQGALIKTEIDPETLEIEPLSLGREMPKYNFVRRRFAEKAFAKVLVRRLKEFGPDLVISSNTPPEIQIELLPAAKAEGAKFLLWLQDIYSVMATKVLKERYGPIGTIIGRYIEFIEDKTLRMSDGVVAISDDFVPLLQRRKINPAKISVIENWAPLDEIPLLERKNHWSERHDLDGKFVFLYAGTMGLKHNPDLIVALAKHFVERNDVAIIVATQGLGRDYLEEERERYNLNSMVLLDFQPFEELPLMLASADVLISILEPEAGVMSVPSKVLSYMCAGRALLGAIPSINLAARNINRIEAGVTVNPDDPEGFIEAAEKLLEDRDFTHKCGERSRMFAQTAFDIERIGTAFLAAASESVL